jgi:ethanolamine permease
MRSSSASTSGGRFKTPHIALILGGVIGFVCALILDQVGGTSTVGASLLTMAVFGAVISYAAVMLSYIRLKTSRPDLPRPYKSPLGIPGAALAIFALLACFAEPTYRPGVYGVAIFLLVAIVYFALYSRSRLVAQAPEEEVALMAAAQKELAH